MTSPAAPTGSPPARRARPVTLRWLPAAWTPLPRHFYQRPPTAVAPQLLNKLLVRDDGRAARIVEVEAYAGSEDPAAHSYRGMTARNASMFGEAGHLYVYFSYGMHWAGNVVCGNAGEGVAVLLRAAEPVAGLALMRSLRAAARHDHDLASGPGKLAQAFGLDRRHDGADLVDGSHGLVIADDGMAPPDDPVVGPRIGISRAVDFPWRWHVRDHRHVSVRRRKRP
ncbi:DNA-3-methyladenine glycosylase [Stenotrophomonas tuberculopleuritidis]|uniref:DNA-3-methyladenine glycosylase n=1 Tax=Stenotrophomonas tuberculopleuritidis TaxID=3055079 RepID=UPI0026E53E1E|nr:DNA-3-methyladenine glycosylase [Stenotrophomonas sp. 704A1]